MGVSSAIASLGDSTVLLHGGEPVVQQLTDFWVRFTKASDDGTASTATADTLVWGNPFDFICEVVAARYVANGTITADNTNFATLQVKTQNAAAGATAVAAALSTTITDSGNVATDIAEAFTLTPANVQVPVGGTLKFAITKAAAGVIGRLGIIMLRLRRVGS
jgi:hypothetical protein